MDDRLRILGKPRPPGGLASGPRGWQAACSSQNAGERVIADDTLDLQRLVDELKRQRDELRVRLHLAKAEARDEFERLEKRWEHVRGRAGVVAKEAAEVSKDVGDAARLVLEEIRTGYQRIRELV